MYAVLSSGGKQYRVEPGSTLLMERLEADTGASVTFDRVLLVGDGEEVTIGTPVVAGASVSGTVIAEERGPKLVIFKFKQKVKYRRRTGHRQQLMRVRIDSITADGKKVAAEAPDKVEAKAKRASKRAAEKAAAEAPTVAAGGAAPSKPAPKAGKPKAAAPDKADADKADADKAATNADEARAKRSAAAKKAAATRARKKAQAEE